MTMVYYVKNIKILINRFSNFLARLRLELDNKWQLYIKNENITIDWYETNHFVAILLL